MKVVNIFYLITGCLQLVPTIQTNSPLAVFIPLTIIICLGVCKELVGELKRYHDDKKVNNTPVVRMTSAAARKAGSQEFEDVTLADVSVGDIIKIADGEQVPADCVLLKVAEDKPECFVSTSPLDGERNLKPKLASSRVSQAFGSLFDPQANDRSSSLRLDCIAPIKELYLFEGRLTLQGPEGEAKIDVHLEEFLHRGSFVENSGHVLALVCYTGNHTKLIMNLGQYVYKRSSFDKILNWILVGNLMLALVLATLIAVLYAGWFKTTYEQGWNYLWYDVGDNSLGWVQAWFRVYLIVNSFVPLDLLFMLELSKLLFTPMMENDAEMMIVDPVLKEVIGFKANTLNLPEELGQVEYIFCDKTGTLTKNELVFRSLVLQDSSRYMFLQDGTKVQDMKNAIEEAQQKQEAFTNFFRCINLCHDCISIEDEQTGVLKYNGPSVDEVTLLEMARDSGISNFIKRDAETTYISLNGQNEEYNVITSFPFTSERKAMSIVLKHPTKEDTALCFVKGADSSVFPMCVNYEPGQEEEVLEDSKGDAHGNKDIKKVEKEVELLAGQGLRTLLYGMKEIKWDGSRDPLEVEVGEIECDLTLLAATAVEDLLQDRVKECIEDFRAAGIGVWMLTGDKGLTAKEIGVSCGLIPNQDAAKEKNQEA